jgi:NAD(P)-dependent dehydrogenase (short-subunit alcohol dehydrogenase family)
LAGADVIIASRHENELENALPNILEGTGRRGVLIAVDLSKRNEAERLAKVALEKMERIDILVNNAGINIPQPIDQVKDEDWDKVVELNVTACMALTRAVAPQMKVRRWGRIIHISSVLGLGSKAARNAYSATKHAVIGLARASALDLGPFGITVNCIAPGPFLTDMPMSLLSDAEKQKFSERTALGRWGQPDELMGPALLLASDAGSYMTGAVLLVDGGVMANTL